MIVNKVFVQKIIILLDMSIKKGKLCDISKFAKNWLLQV